MKEKKKKKALSHQFLDQSVMLSLSTDLKKLSFSTLGELMIPSHYFASLMLEVQVIHWNTKRWY